MESFIEEQKKKFTNKIVEKFGDRPLNKAQVSQFLDISESSLNRAIANKSITHYKQPGRNGRVSFMAEDISDFFHKQIVPRADDLEIRE